MAEELALFDEDEKPNIVGKVSAIFFQNATNFFKVLLVKVTEANFDWHEDEIVVTGSFGEIKEEETYQFFGKLVTHPKYGQQFQAENYQLNKPTTKEGLIAYLSSDHFAGIGKKTAEKIVTTLGTDAINKILQDSSVLTPLGLNQKKITALVTELSENNGMDQIIIGLNGYGFGSQLAYSIYERYQQDTLKIITENPYQLVADIAGIGFKKADNIAAKQGFAADAPERIQAAILQEITELAQTNGDTYTTAEPLLTASLRLLEESRHQSIDPEAIAQQLVELANQGKIVGEENRIYLKSLYNAEWQIAEHLLKLEKKQDPISYPGRDLDKEIRRIEKLFGIQYGDSQIATIKKALTNRVFLLTGGPGTGKTTIINAIVTLFGELNGLSLDQADYKDKPFPVLLAAPTGRAAKRMSETTDLPASTIHRLLGLNGRETNPDVATKDLEGGLLIIDEMSMVDTYLFRLLIHAVPSTMQVILVGDKDQLPSVGPGQVFYDLLTSGVLPANELTEIYRQDDQSSIIPLAHAIKEGKLPTDFSENKVDRSFIACNAYQVDSVISQVVTRAKTKGFTTKDIQVLAPMYRGAAGINKLNIDVQKILNPITKNHKKEVSFRDQTFRIGDKVLHLVNSPEQNVFNGDIGEVVSIQYAKDKGNEDKTDKMTIQFDATEVTYGRNDWSKLTLAFCTSIHKAQGSEFTMVILPMVHQYQRMLQRNLLYTAVTRAEKLLILVGEKQAFLDSVAHESINRKTTLAKRLEVTFEGTEVPYAKADLIKDHSTDYQHEVPTDQSEPVKAKLPQAKASETDYHLTPQLVASGQIDPMIGMNDVTPQMFMNN
ncbi:exodeoxyribonuclease V subunit alpha [Loigolactobacillus backii]|uniref:SF1B family DNA helicase RecD2 n=1 Tax=Loigolactobacillus backii TaxID=375175 RepID=UPI0007F0DEC9|nr:ATP-dependent RecD-like DNA helicase [Loigolactobacillus backii]ANK59722.1 exodeoxyribonuclease V subunit alpha [Loigolactobacillus backii]ANK64717.1 exodeoxyribonuclease V subunit alpha [Loigolactobacillus backii]ANK66834.1 exodeoxyribonuclease V subunit alpha [Loigolactobacillus backii]OLF70548.1 exodeoxyribonuclease V subunit alpha [Loigolactobacillus backii]PIO87543.1 exodeoxyribonuclease V subunit alpha [Loigolactobacillus backii]